MLSCRTKSLRSLLSSFRPTAGSTPGKANHSSGQLSRASAIAFDLLESRMLLSATAISFAPSTPTSSGLQTGASQTDVFAVDQNGALTVSWADGSGTLQNLQEISPAGTFAAGTAVATSVQFGTSQTDVFAVDNTGALTEYSVVNNGQWSGPAALSAAGTFPAGCAVTASQQFGFSQTDVFAVNNAGNLTVSWVLGGGAWRGPAPIGAAGTFAPGAAVTASQQDEVNQTDVFSVDEKGAVTVSWVDNQGAWKGPVEISSVGAFLSAAQVGASEQFGTNLTDAFAIDTTGTMQMLSVAGLGGWQSAVAISPAGTFAAGAPVTASQQFGLSQTDVFAVNSAGAPTVSWVDGSGDWSGPISIGRSGAFATSAPISVAQQAGVDQTDAFAASLTGDLDLFWVAEGNAWQSDGVDGTVTSNPAPTLAPTTATLTATANIFPVGDSCSLYCKVAAQNGSESAPTGTITIFEDGIQKNVFTLGADGSFVVTWTAETAGPTKLDFVYSGDANYAASTSNTINQTYTALSQLSANVTRAVIPSTNVAGQPLNARMPASFKNTGSILSGTYTVVLYADTSTGGLSGNQVALETVTRRTTLRTNRTLALTLTAKKLPSTLPAGIYYLLVEVTDPLGDVNIVNTSQTIAVSSPFVALAASSAPVKPAAVAVNRYGSTLISVVNNGNVSATGTMYITLDLSPDGVTPATNFTAQTTNVRINIKPGKSTRLPVRFKIPAALAAGAYYPLITVSADGVAATTVGSPFSVE